MLSITRFFRQIDPTVHSESCVFVKNLVSSNFTTNSLLGTLNFHYLLTYLQITVFFDR